MDFFGSKVGKWTVFLGNDQMRGKIDLRILWRETDASVTYNPETRETRMVHTFEVAKFEMAQCPEVMFSDEGPALTGAAWVGSQSEVRDFLQALVNEAAKLGVLANGNNSQTQELRAVRFHLEDMRKLALKDHQTDALR